MESKKISKKNKNLFVWEWIIDLLDKEGERYDGPGTVASAAIHHFCVMMSDAEKQKAFNAYRADEVKYVYADDVKKFVGVLGARAAKLKRTRSHSPLEVG